MIVRMAERLGEFDVRQTDAVSVLWYPRPRSTDGFCVGGCGRGAWGCWSSGLLAPHGGRVRHIEFFCTPVSLGFCCAPVSAGGGGQGGPVACLASKRRSQGLRSEGLAQTHFFTFLRS